MTLEEKYNEKRQIPSDISEHLPTLKKYAEECNHITEMGVRSIVSTYALLIGKPQKLISYDYYPINVDEVISLSNENGIDFKFICADTRDTIIEETDLLFIDTLHNYNQLKKELELHGGKVKKYLIFHDTTTFEFGGESYVGEKEVGLWPAIEEFLQANPNWIIYERFTNNNGLTILKNEA
jgi:hypothetical protein